MRRSTENRTKKRWVVAIAALAVLAMAGIAFAYWTTSGGGDGTAGVGTSAAVTITQDNPKPSGLTPGGAAQGLNYTINNPQATNQTVTSVTVEFKNSNGSAWSEQADAGKPACTAADFDVVQPSGPWGDLASGDHAYTDDGSIALKNLGTNQDNCKGVTVPLKWTAA